MDYYIDIQTNSLEHDAKAHTIEMLKIDSDGTFHTIKYEIINNSKFWSVPRPIQLNPLDPKIVIELLPFMGEGDRLMTFNGHFATNVLYNTFGDISQKLGVRHVISLMDMYLYYNPKDKVSLSSICSTLRIPTNLHNIYKYLFIHQHISHKVAEYFHKTT